MSFWDKLRQAFGNQLVVEEDTALEQFCAANYLEIGKIAYKNKRASSGVNYSVYLNEMITPKAFEVDKLFKGTYPVGDIFSRADYIGDKVSKTITWTDDKNLSTSGDYYLYPSETVITQKGDCEDHAFLVASCDREIGVAYGFYSGNGHAFNVFVLNGELYILDTVGNSSYIERYTNKSFYTIHYIITRNHTYLVKDGVRFGEIAGW